MNYPVSRLLTKTDRGSYCIKEPQELPLLVTGDGLHGQDVGLEWGSGIPSGFFCRGGCLDLGTWSGPLQLQELAGKLK